MAKSLSGVDMDEGVVIFEIYRFRADWQAHMTKALPNDLQSSLPSIEEIEKEIE